MTNPRLLAAFVIRFDGTQVQQLTDNQWEEGGPAWRTKKIETTCP